MNYANGVDGEVCSREVLICTVFEIDGTKIAVETAYVGNHVYKITVTNGEINKDSLGNEEKREAFSRIMAEDTHNGLCRLCNFKYRLPINDTRQ